MPGKLYSHHSCCLQLDIFLPIHHMLHFPWTDSSMLFENGSGQTGLLMLRCLISPGNMKILFTQSQNSTEESKSTKISLWERQKLEKGVSIISCIHQSKHIISHCSNASHKIAHHKSEQYPRSPCPIPCAWHQASTQATQTCLSPAYGL